MKSRRLLLFISLYLIPLSGVGTDLYSPSLPAITVALGSTTTLVKLTLVVYLYGFAIGQLLWGTLSDIRGRKPMLIISLIIFCVVSYLATLSHSVYFLLAMRTLQGLSAAGASVISKTLLSDTLTGQQLKKASIYLVSAWGLGPILAPVVGGYLQYYYGWHANFYFFVGYSFSMIAIVAILLKETNLKPHEPKWHRIFKNYSEIFSNKVFVGSVMCLGLGYSIIMIFNIFTPFLVETVLGRTSITYGHMALFIGVAFLSGSFSSRALIRFKASNINRIGTIAMIVIAIVTLVAVYFIKMSPVSLVIPVCLLTFFMGIMQTNLTAHALTLFPHIGGAASASMGSVLCVVAALVTSFATLVHHANSQVAVSWAYAIVILIYFLIYWLVVDRSYKKSAPK